MGVLTWLVLGTFVGLLANMAVPGRFPGGLLGMVLGGMGGAFLGGATFTLVLGRGVEGIDPLSLLIALVGATALLILVRKAGHAEPRPR